MIGGKPPTQRLSTGVPAVDEILGDGIPSLGLCARHGPIWLSRVMNNSFATVNDGE